MATLTVALLGRYKPCPYANNFVIFQSFIEYLLCIFLSSRLFLHCRSTFSFLLYSYCKFKSAGGVVFFVTLRCECLQKFEQNRHSELCTVRKAAICSIAYWMHTSHWISTSDRSNVTHVTNSQEVTIGITFHGCKIWVLAGSGKLPVVTKLIMNKSIWKAIFIYARTSMI